MNGEVWKQDAKTTELLRTACHTYSIIAGHVGFMPVVLGLLSLSCIQGTSAARVQTTAYMLTGWTCTTVFFITYLLDELTAPKLFIIHFRIKFALTDNHGYMTR